MTDLVDSIRTAGSNRNDAPVPQHRFAQEALERNKREGMRLAVWARFAALATTGAMLPFLNPSWDVLWYEFLLVCLMGVGLAQQRVGGVGQNRAELGLLFADLALMTVVLTAPNPWSPSTLPSAMIYRFDVFQFFYLILCAGVLSYSWRTIVAIGNWTAVMWIGGAVVLWFFGRRDPALGDAVRSLYAEHPEVQTLFDPNSVNFDLRVQEVIVFFLVACILAVAVRRYQALVLDSAEMVRERTNLARYFSPSMVDELSTKDEPLGRIRSHDAAVLFVDIVGFTAWSDGRPAQEVIETLRSFHGEMESAVFAHGGTLDKYLGDGLMATFGTPLPAADDGTRAMACVQAMADGMDRLNARRRADGLAGIDARFGLHYGPVVLGDIGANRLEFAVLGDTVNVASRLEALTRALGVRAVVSDAAVRAAGSRGRARRAPDQRVRGVAEPLAVWVLD